MSMGYPLGAPRNMWFADIDEDRAGSHYPWQPFLQLDGWVVPADAHFRSRDECEEFIRDRLVGSGWMDGPRRYACPDCGAAGEDWCVNLTTGEKRHTFHTDRMRFQYGGWPS